MMGGFAVYFWVDRLRRKVTYWEVSINLVFSTCLIFKFNFAVSISSSCNRRAFDLLKLSVAGFSFCFYSLFFPDGHIAAITFFNVALITINFHCILYFIHHLLSSMGNMPLPIAKFCLCSRGTL